MIRISIFLIASVLITSCKPRYEKEITTHELEEHISYLGSEELKGRYPGTEEDELTLNYITDQFKRAGLVLYERKGLQPFSIVTDIKPGPSNRLTFNNTELEMDSDFRPFSFSVNGEAEGEVIFAGYGFQIDQDSLKWDDYRSLDVKNKLVMLLRGAPETQGGASPYINFSEDRGKALLAADLGASGVILVSGEESGGKDELEELQGRQHPINIPVIQLTRSAADRFLATAGADSLGIIQANLARNLSPVSFRSGLSMNLSVDLQPVELESANTIATLEGADPMLRSQYVILGAHHDHLGMGGPGSSSRQPDTVAVHYGADDNASGVAGVIEISEYLVSRSPSRSILFTTFGAEEMGLIGSKYLAENSPVDLASVQAMINLDMVGRLNEERQLQVGGIGTSPLFRNLLDSLNLSFNFNIKYSNEGYGPSDHSSFYAKDVPVLFISTGAHPDYHTPADNPASINYEGEQEVLEYVSEIAEALANKPEKIAFTEAGPKIKGSSRGRRGGVTLGLMPDVTYDGNDGMPVMFVTEGKPAAVGGIQKGDIIVAIEGKSVGNVYDYMSRMNILKEGMDIVVSVKRDDDMIDLVIRI